MIGTALRWNRMLLHEHISQAYADRGTPRSVTCDLLWLAVTGSYRSRETANCLEAMQFNLATHRSGEFHVH